MSKSFRNCNAATMVTGKSKCQLDFGKIKGAVIVQHGTKIPADITAEEFEELVHADNPNRVLPVFTFCEYATSGGEVQINAVGYGPNKVTDVSARTDTFTMEQYSESIAAQITKAMNSEFDAYFVDESYVMYGLNDGTDVLAGFPLSAVYASGSPHPTSSAKGQLLINFAHKDARKLLEQFDYTELGFDITRGVYGLTPVKFVSTGEANKYKLVESTGGYDRSEEFGSLIQTAAASVLVGASTVTYADGVFTFTSTTGTPSLKAPSVLYEHDIKGIVCE